MESSLISQVQKEDVPLSRHTGPVKQPRSFNLFTALFCCIQAQDGPKPHSRRALLDSPEDGTIVQVRLLLFLLHVPCLLPELKDQDQGKICAVIDLDETLVHRTFKPISNADFIVPVEIEGTTHQVYVLKRPYVDQFLHRMGELFECVLFTASLAKVPNRRTQLHLFCLMSHSSRPHLRTNIKNTPISRSAVPVVSWFDDVDDAELLHLLPVIGVELTTADDDLFELCDL
uniref:Mitochondrial import inner membrane translocase subunit TIM50 n=1 Tax=Mola mola TaxID=94237 RepID=A0A3Q4B821_MOLML